MRQFLLITLMFFSFVTPASAEVDEYAVKREKAEKYAQIEIEKCEKASLEKRSSTSTEEMREGNLELALCLENYISELTGKTLFLKNSELRNEVKSDLEKLRSSYGHFYWNLYNSHDRCYDEKKGVQCGMQYQPMHNSKYAQLLSDTLVDIYAQLIQYGYIE